MRTYKLEDTVTMGTLMDTEMLVVILIHLYLTMSQLSATLGVNLPTEVGSSPHCNTTFLVIFPRVSTYTPSSVEVGNRCQHNSHRQVSYHQSHLTNHTHYLINEVLLQSCIHKKHYHMCIKKPIKYVVKENVIHVKKKICYMHTQK